MRLKKYLSEEERKNANRLSVKKYRMSPKGKRTTKKCAAKRKRWAQEHPTEWRKHLIENNIKHLYGISRQDYEIKLQTQNYRCAICGEVLDDTKGKNGKALDHNHTTGHLRDFLCNDCNKGLGYFDDSFIRLEQAANYLRTWEKQ